MFFFDDNVFALLTGRPLGRAPGARGGAEGACSSMICDMCALERGLAEGEPRWGDPQGRGRTQPGECRVKDTVAGVQVGCFPDLYAALGGKLLDQVITL